MTTRWETIRRAGSKARARFAAIIDQPIAQVEAYVDVRVLAEDVYQLSPHTDGYLAPGINAVLDPAGEAIRLRPGVSEDEARFFIAHELGHAELEGLCAIIEDGPEHISTEVTGFFATDQGVLRGYNTRERREQEANLFALELLIPAADVWNQLQRAGWTLEDLASRYGVTIDAVRSQLLNVVCLYPPRRASRQQDARRTRATIDLHANQTLAVEAPLPTLVIAGPGTGKTRCMVERYIAMLESGIPPQHMLVLTFSNKAAEELRERIQAALPEAFVDQTGNVHIYTFHAFGLELLRRYYERLNLPPTVPLLTPGELFILFKQRVSELPLNIFKSLRQPGQHLAGLIKEVSRAKDELITPEQYAQLVVEEAEAAQLQITALLGDHRKGEREKGERLQRRIEKHHEVARFYTAYQQILHDLGAVDYGDLVMRSVELLHDPQIAAEIQQEFQYVMVDEFQDINYASGELVYQIDGRRQQVWAVGDPCQGIYGFRGASYVHMADFRERYPQTTLVHLDRNYRSLGAILRASDAQIACATAAQSRPPMTPQRPQILTRSVVEEYTAATEQEELRLLAQLIRRASVSHRYPRPRLQRRHSHRPIRRYPKQQHTYGDVAVLCRTRAQASAVASVLQAHNIPVDYSGNLLDQPICKDLLALCTLVRKGDRSGLLRVLSMEDHRLIQADIDCLHRAAATGGRGLYRVLSRVEEIEGLSDAGRATLEQLRAIIKQLNRHATASTMLVEYLFLHSSAFRRAIVEAASGSGRHRRTLQHIGLLLLAARDLTKPSLVLNDASAAGFIRYVRELVEAGEANQWEEMETDRTAVQVMTVHRSKGLEFPVVIVPYLAEGQFPRKPPPPKAVPHLSRMVHGAPRNEAEEERYACYVGMTRARDRLLLLRAAQYDGKAAARSPLLPALASWRQRSCHPSEDLTPQNLDPGHLQPDIRDNLLLRDYGVDTYLTCPRKYLYEEVYRVRSRRSPLLKVHGAIRSAAQMLPPFITDHGRLPEAAELDAILDDAWRQRGPIDVPYEAEYRAMARAQLTDIAEHLGIEDFPIEAARYVVVDLAAGAVQIRIDRVEHQADGPVFVLLHTGQLSTDHRTRTRAILANWYYEQMYGLPTRVELHYPQMSCSQPLNYRDGTVQKHVDEINAALEDITRGDFPARPSQHNCATCPFCLICPI